MRFKIILLTFMALLGLAGCASTATLSTTVRSVSYLNPDVNNQAAPVVVTFYQLTSPHAFNRATFFSLYNNSNAVLGNSLIDKDSYEVRPKESRGIRIELSPKTRYLGIVAAYRNTEKARWRRTVLVPANSGTITLGVLLQSQGISVSAPKKRYLCAGGKCLF